MKYKHIVFDIDGTLIDTEYAVLHSLQETIKGLSGRKIPCSVGVYTLLTTEELFRLAVSLIIFKRRKWIISLC